MNWKQIATAIGGICAGFALVMSTAIIALPAVSQIAGLAVAQSSTNWNSVIDASRGDAQTSGILGMSSYLFNGLTFDRQRGTGGSANVNLIGTITPSDAYTNPTTASQVLSLNSMFNGTTWDRSRSASADNLVNTGIQSGGNVSFDGTAWDRVPGISNTNNTATTSSGVRYQTQLSTWSITNLDVGATQSTVSRTAGGGSVRHVATSITACRGDTATAAPAVVNLRDGASGAGTVLRSWVIGVSVANESRCVDLSGLNITGSANTAMTIEFTAAGSATSTSTVALTGYSTP